MRDIVFEPNDGAKLEMTGYRLEKATVREVHEQLARFDDEHPDLAGTGQVLVCCPTTAMAKVPVLTGAIRGSTEGDDPFAHLMTGRRIL